MSFDWKKTLKATLALAATGVITFLLSNRNDDNFEDWIENASDEELENEYEQRRQQWAENGYGGNGEKTPEMKLIDKEISRRSNEKWENNPNRNRDPNFRWTDANRWDKD